jgi:hypothetical protein
MCLWGGWQLKKHAFPLVLQWFPKDCRFRFCLILMDSGGHWATILGARNRFLLDDNFEGEKQLQLIAFKEPNKTKNS